MGLDLSVFLKFTGIQFLLDALAWISAGIASYLGISPQAVTSALTIFLMGGTVMALLPCLKRWGYKKAESAAFAKTAVLIVSYSLFASMLLIINKVAVTYIPAASTILLCQMVTCSVFVKTLALTGSAEVEPLIYEKALKFVPLVLGFVAILFCNVKALQYNPVDTIICFRASTPIAIAFTEYVFLGRELPSARSWSALIGVFLGVVVYVRADMNFAFVPYLWLSLWYFFSVMEMVLVKYVCDTVEMTAWTRAYYQNALSVVPIMLLALIDNDMAVLRLGMPSLGVVATIASCLAGIGMSYFSFALRATISATSFSVIGNICKVLTIAVNLVMWEKHSDLVGTMALFGCLFLGSFYKQAPLRKDKRVPIAGAPIPEAAKLLQKGGDADSL